MPRPPEGDDAKPRRSPEEDDWKKSIEDAAQDEAPPPDADKDANRPGPESVQRVRLARMQREYDPSESGHAASPGPGEATESEDEEDA
jgi:hypothetical protein